MRDTLTLFDRIPQLFPTHFENTLMSGSIFDEFDKMFNSQKLRQMTVYPTDIYNEIQDEKVIALVIEVAIAGVKKEQCEIKLDGNKLQVAIGCAPKLVEDTEEEKTDITKDYIQRQIAERTSYMNWTLSNRVEKEKIEVTCVDGILKIRLPIIHAEPEQIKVLEIK